MADDEESLTMAVVRLASRYGWYGYRRVTAMLQWEGWRVNHKRVERIWRRGGLKVPAKQPDGTRPTFAGMQVEVQEDPGGRLLVQYQGQTIPTQEAPPRRPTVLRETAAAPPESSGPARGIKGDNIREAFDVCGSDFLRPVWEFLGTQCTYDELRLARIYLRQEGRLSD